MTARRRPFASLCVALLVWLTGVSSASALHVQERRLMVAGEEAVSAVSLTVSRSTLVVAREVTRAPALVDDAPAILAYVEAPVASRRQANAEFETDCRARRAQRIASAYDAMAPPVMAEAIG